MVDYIVAGVIERVHERLRALLADPEVLHATILQFDPDYQAEAIQPKTVRPPKDWLQCGILL
jgi:hypothetical protein